MKGNIIYKKIIPGKEPEYAGFPEELHPDIQSFLINQDIKSLYIHQAEAFANSLGGKNVVITTPTASGKFCKILLHGQFLFIQPRPWQQTSTVL